MCFCVQGSEGQQNGTIQVKQKHKNMKEQLWGSGLLFSKVIN